MILTVVNVHGYFKAKTHVVVFWFSPHNWLLAVASQLVQFRYYSDATSRVRGIYLKTLSNFLRTAECLEQLGRPGNNNEYSTWYKMVFEGIREAQVTLSHISHVRPGLFLSFSGGVSIAIKAPAFQRGPARIVIPEV